MRMRIANIKVVRLCSVCDTRADYQCVVCGKNFCTRDGCPDNGHPRCIIAFAWMSRQRSRKHRPYLENAAFFSYRLEPAAFPVRLPDIPLSVSDKGTLP